MSVALGQDTKTSAMQLGKALNDPIKGVSALQRVGVSFTAAQREQIKALVASGNTMGAQKVIIGELNKEFGGSAKAAGETLPGQLSKARNAFEDMAGNLTSSLLPAMTGFAGIVGTASAYLTKHEGAAKAIIGVLGGFAAIVLAVNAAMKVQAALTTLATAAKFLFTTSTATATAATVAQTGAQQGLNVAMRLNPIGLVITALAALGVGLYIAWQKSETFRAIVTGGLNAVAGAGKALATFVTEKIPAAFKAAVGWVREHWPEIATLLSGPFAPIVALATNAFGVRSALEGALRSAKTFVGERIGDIVGFFTGIPDRIAAGLANLAGAAGLGPDSFFRRIFRQAAEFVGEKIGDIVDFFRRLPGRAGDAIGGAAGQLRDAVVDLFGQLPGWAKKILGISSPSRVFAEIGRNVIDGFISGLGNRAGALNARAIDVAQDAVRAAGGILGGIGGAIGGAIGIGGGRKAPGTGAVFGDTDYLPELHRRLSALAAATGYPIQIVSGGRTLGEQAALYAAYLNGTGNLAAKPDQNAPHVRGVAADAYIHGRPLRDVIPNVSAFGLSYTVGSEPWHVEMGLARGGIVTGEMLGDTGLAGRRREAVLPLESAYGRRVLADAFTDALSRVGADNANPIQFFGGVHVRDDHDISKLAAGLSTALAVRR